MYIKFDKARMLLKSSRIKSRHIKGCSNLLVKKRDKEIWHERMNSQDRKKDLKVQKSPAAIVIFEVST